MANALTKKVLGSKRAKGKALRLYRFDLLLLAGAGVIWFFIIWGWYAVISRSLDPTAPTAYSMSGFYVGLVVVSVAMGVVTLAHLVDTMNHYEQLLDAKNAYEDALDEQAEEFTKEMLK